MFDQDCQSNRQICFTQVSVRLKWQIADMAVDVRILDIMFGIHLYIYIYVFLNKIIEVEYDFDSQTSIEQGFLINILK